MSEHVGAERLDIYFEPPARLSATRRTPAEPRHLVRRRIPLGARSFLYRYVFPDGELIDVGDTTARHGTRRLRDPRRRGLREHYADTLRRWVANLEAAGTSRWRSSANGRARVWLLYMSGSINGFDDAGSHCTRCWASATWPTARATCPDAPRLGLSADR